MKKPTGNTAEDLPALPTFFSPFKLTCSVQISPCYDPLCRTVSTNVACWVNARKGPKRIYRNRLVFVYIYRKSSALCFCFVFVFQCSSFLQELSFSRRVSSKGREGVEGKTSNSGFGFKQPCWCYIEFKQRGFPQCSESADIDCPERDNNDRYIDR